MTEYANATYCSIITTDITFFSWVLYCMEFFSIEHTLFSKK